MVINTWKKHDTTVTSPTTKNWWKYDSRWFVWFKSNTAHDHRTAYLWWSTGEAVSCSSVEGPEENALNSAIKSVAQHSSCLRILVFMPLGYYWSFSLFFFFFFLMCVFCFVWCFFYFYFFLVELYRLKVTLMVEKVLKWCILLSLFYITKPWHSNRASVTGHRLLYRNYIYI